MSDEQKPQQAPGPGRISFTSDGTRYGSVVTVDGKHVRGVSRVEFSMDAGGKPVLVLTVRPRYVELNMPDDALVIQEECDRAHEEDGY